MGKDEYLFFAEMLQKTVRADHTTDFGTYNVIKSHLLGNMVQLVTMCYAEQYVLWRSELLAYNIQLKLC